MCWRVSTIIAKCLCEYVPSPLEYLNTHAPFWLCFLTPISQLLEYYYIKCHKSNWNKFFSICFFTSLALNFLCLQIVKSWKKPGVKIKFVQKCQGEEIQTTKTTNTLSYYTQREIIIIKTTKVTSKIVCLFVAYLVLLFLSLTRCCVYFFLEKNHLELFSLSLAL